MKLVRFAELMNKERKAAFHTMRTQVENARKCIEHNNRYIKDKKLKRIFKHLDNVEELLYDD